MEQHPQPWAVFGPSDTIRTCDLHIPNVARYQLRYTRIFSFCYYTTLGAKIKDFPVCGQSCGQSRFSTRFGDPAKSRKRPCRKAFQASAFLVVDGAGATPKAGALPTALHPVIEDALPDSGQRIYDSRFDGILQVLCSLTGRYLHNCAD